VRLQRLRCWNLSSQIPVATQPRATGPAGPWRVTASITGGLVQISNHHESRVIRKAEVETYLRQGKPW
jgi:hypothetical protein